MTAFVFYRKAGMKIATYQEVIDKLGISSNQFISECQFWQILTENVIYEKAERTAGNIIDQIKRGGAA